MGACPVDSAEKASIGAASSLSVEKQGGAGSEAQRGAAGSRSPVERRLRNDSGVRARLVIGAGTADNPAFRCSWIELAMGDIPPPELPSMNLTVPVPKEQHLITTIATKRVPMSVGCCGSASRCRRANYGYLARTVSLGADAKPVESTVALDPELPRDQLHDAEIRHRGRVRGVDAAARRDRRVTTAVSGGSARNGR